MQHGICFSGGILIISVVKWNLRKISVIKEIDFKWTKICMEIASKIKQVEEWNVY